MEQEKVKKGVTIPFLLFSAKTTNAIGRRFRGLGKYVMLLSPSLKSVVPKLELGVDGRSYAAASFFSSLIYGILFGIIVFIVLTVRAAENAPNAAVAIGFAFTFVFLMLHLFYPKIIITKVAVAETKDLLFALREVMMDIDGGVPLFDAMKNVSLGNYRYVSKDFEWVVRQIEGGVPEREALKQLAIKTESEYFKRAIWQLVNALESGAGMNSALLSIVNSLEGHLYREIKNYSANLNFMMLIYMLVAAALPSLGITMLVLLSAFSGLGVTIETLGLLVGSSAAMQVIMIGYMRSIQNAHG
jgi:flagellar protein FlaJ